MRQRGSSPMVSHGMVRYQISGIVMMKDRPPAYKRVDERWMMGPEYRGVENERDERRYVKEVVRGREGDPELYVCTSK